MTRSPEKYIKIVTVLVPIYAVVIIGWLAGASACDLSPGLCGTSRAQGWFDSLWQAASRWQMSSCWTG